VRGRSRFASLCLSADHPEELFTIDELDLPTLRKPLCLVSKNARRDNVPAGNTLRRHHAVKLSYRRNTNLPRPPLFALNQVAIRSPRKNQVHSAICTADFVFLDSKAASAEMLTDQLLKLLPRYPLQSAFDARRRHFAMQRSPATPLEC